LPNRSICERRPQYKSPDAECAGDRASPARTLRAARNAGLLPLRNGDCSEERIFGRRRTHRIAFEQNLTAQAMQESVAPVFSCLAAVQPSACPSGWQRSDSRKEHKRIFLAKFDDNFRVASSCSVRFTQP
jgi:hypothetical protein